MKHLQTLEKDHAEELPRQSKTLHGIQIIKAIDTEKPY